MEVSLVSSALEGVEAPRIFSARCSEVREVLANGSIVAAVPLLVILPQALEAIPNGQKGRI